MKGAVVIVTIKAILGIVAYINVGPAVIIEVSDGHTKTPTIIGDTGNLGHVGECTIVVVVKERGVCWLRLSVWGIVGGTVDEVDVKPSGEPRYPDSFGRPRHNHRWIGLRSRFESTSARLPAKRFDTRGGRAAGARSPRAFPRQKRFPATCSATRSSADAPYGSA
jgi:hypothetical protein